MGAPKGNKNAEGNKGGQPPYYSSPEELQARINDYFENCPDKRNVVVGDKVVEVPAITICGLALHLGFSSRQSLLDYAEKVEYFDIIKKAKLKIERNYEQNLSFSNPTGSIFALKNMGWVDKNEVHHSGEIIIDFTNE
jgi:hypothetical protein